MVSYSIGIQQDGCGGAIVGGCHVGSRDPDLNGVGAPVRWAEEDVNGDGLLDRVFFFSMADLVAKGALAGASTVAELNGRTLFEACAVAGRDSVRIVQGPKE